MNTGLIVKSKTSEGNFTIVNNEMAQNQKLSWAARGLLLYLLSLPSNWGIYRKDLANRSDIDGYSKMNTAFNELIKQGYILSIEIRNERGRFKGYNYIVYSTPTLPEKVMENDNPFL